MYTVSFLIHLLAFGLILFSVLKRFCFIVIQMQALPKPTWKSQMLFIFFFFVLNAIQFRKVQHEKCLSKKITFFRKNFLNSHPLFRWNVCFLYFGGWTFIFAILRKINIFELERWVKFYLKGTWIMVNILILFRSKLSYSLFSSLIL